jgi:transcription elongation factor Elf1
MNVFLKLLCVISPTHRQTDRKIERLMLLFCPLCGGLLIINNENDSSAFTCKSCVYTFPIKDKSYSARVELTRKKVDDVLGGEDAWKNVDSTEGKTLLFSNFIFYISLYSRFVSLY